MQVQSFAELGVSTDVVRALRATGIEDPFPIQAAVVPDVLAGRDVLVQSPTGSGKTLAFAVPRQPAAKTRQQLLSCPSCIVYDASDSTNVTSLAMAERG
jgi:superfamily II DNA/RNA helicase